MNNKTLFFLFFVNWTNVLFAQFEFTIEEMPLLPESVSNNAVCEGFHNGIPYVYTFGGIDSSLSQSGIHQRSWGFNTQTALWETLEDLPDTDPKIAAAASRIGEVIYIIGGYSVAPNGSETSSRKVHRFSTISNTFLSDGSNLPIAIDDQVQAVWRDSLIYVVTGWSNTSNVALVQIYDPTNDSWSTGTPLQNNNLFKAFGASGTIVKDTIFYFGGAVIDANFSATFVRRKGIIDANDPTQISWSVDTLSTSLLNYRSAVTSIHDTVYCIGGSNVTYNYDAVAYNGSGIVAPNNRILQVAGPSWDTTNYILPMDLRGVAKTSPNEVYLVGGIEAGGFQSKKMLKLTWRKSTSVSIQDVIMRQVDFYPNPFKDFIQLASLDSTLGIEIFNVLGKLVFKKQVHADEAIETKKLNAGIYFISWTNGSQSGIKKIIKK